MALDPKKYSAAKTKSRLVNYPVNRCPVCEVDIEKCTHALRYPLCPIGGEAKINT